MLTITRRLALTHLFLLLTITSLPLASLAAVAIESNVVSGTITELNSDNSIKLDNGKTYYPLRENVVITMSVGDPITLKYFIRGEDRFIYYEFAPGLNALSAAPATNSKEANEPK